MDIIKDKIKIMELSNTVKKEFDINQNYIIPDIKSDIVKVVNTSGNVFIEKQEIQNDRIKIEGSILAFNLYIDGEGNNNSLDLEMPFSDFISIGNMEREITNDDFETEISINKLELKIVNERKVELNANVISKVNIYSENEMDIVKEINDCDNKIEKKEKTVTLENLIGKGSTKCSLKENVKITDVEKVINIVSFRYSLENIDTKISYNKVLAKSDVVLEILYRNEENIINKAEARFPIMGFIDIQDVSDTNECKLKNELRNINMSINNDSTLNLEMEFEYKCYVYEKMDTNIIDDMYGIRKSYNYRKNKIQLSDMNLEKVTTKNINEKVLIDNINQLYDTNVSVLITNKYNQDGLDKYVGTLEVNYIYNTFDSNNIESMIQKFDFEFEVEENTEIQISISSKNFIILPDSSVDSKIELNIERVANDTRCIEIIDDIEEVEEEARENYSIIIYFVQKGDSLWKIAKRFRSTVDRIAEINNIEDVNVIDVGQKLYIPRIA